MRIAIVDDEQAMREQLAEYIKKYADEQHLQLDTCSLPSGDALLQSEDRAFDIIIFDIDMPGTSGLDTARKIRETDENVVILFVTNIAQYAINGYEVDAVDYIIKPVGYYDFAMKFQKAVRRAGRTQSNRIVIDTVNGPVGLSTIAVSVGEEADTVEEAYEPFLIMEGYLDRTPKGRVATELAWKKLGLSSPGGRQMSLL